MSPQRLRLSPIHTGAEAERGDLHGAYGLDGISSELLPRKGRKGDANLSAVCACLSTIGGGHAGRAGKRLALLRSGRETSAQAHTFARWAQIVREIYCLPIVD